MRKPLPSKPKKLEGHMATDILIVDDEADIRELVSGILSDEGHGTRTAKDSDDALTAIQARRPQLVFLDIWLQGSKLDGLQLLEIIKADHPTLPIVMISGHGNIETAVTATKLGAYDFIEKPFKADRLVLVADRAIEASRLKREVTELRARAGATNRIVGKSTAMNQLRQVIERIAPANSRIMITGTPGAGKELVARTIHEASNRAGGPFFVINAATIAPETMEVRKSCACSSTRISPASAARRAFMLMCVSSPRAPAICRQQSLKARFAKICSIVYPSSRSACRRLRNAGKIFRN
jgi:two-component system nitrogen regulation response regulator NtrX